jgi:ABC-2 type transport system permease protein
MTIHALSIRHAIPSRARPPGRGFRKLVKVEGKLALRVPMGLVLGVLAPVILLVIFNAIPALKKPAPGSTLTLFAEYIPVLICMSLCLITLVGLPVPVVTNRQMGVLRRFSTTPAPPSWLLAAQVIINLALALIAIVILLAGGALFFGVHFPSQWAGFVGSVLLATAAMFAIGLLITAVAPAPQVAGVLGTVLFYPLLFFAGLWTPQQNMSPLLQHIGNYTPLGAAVQAMDAAMQGNFPPARPLLVMAAYAIVFGVAAVRLFRWE